MNSLSILDPAEKTVSLQNSIGMPVVQEADLPEKSALLLEMPEQTKVMTEVSTSYHLHTIWLFTRNDLKSIVFPESAFGIFSALSGPVLTTNASPRLWPTLSRVPLVLLWCWINVIIFDVANQRLPTSVIEDSVNKPWRPLPSGRLTLSQARRFLLLILPIGFVATMYLGGLEETVAMMVLTWMYNDLGGADESYIVRNLINAFGFVCYSSGATLVACGRGRSSFLPVTYEWLGIVGGIVFTTLQMQDMADQEGDRARNRGTVPLVLGDWPARWTIAIPVAFWSLACPAFWQLNVYAYIVPVLCGATVASRILIFRTVDSDKTTWKLWNVWITALYLLPLVKYHVA